MSEPWTSRRILTELCDRPRREAIATAFWQHSEPRIRAVAIAELSRALSFRIESLRKAPVEKKANWLLQRLPNPRFGELFDTALMLYHTHEKADLLGAFLDQWGIPHENGIVEGDPAAPSPEAVAAAVEALRGRFEAADMALYLATAGLLMEGSQTGWSAALWPEADRLAGEVRPAVTAG